MPQLRLLWNPGPKQSNLSAGKKEFRMLQAGQYRYKGGSGGVCPVVFANNRHFCVTTWSVKHVQVVDRTGLDR